MATRSLQRLGVRGQGVDELRLRVDSGHSVPVFRQVKGHSARAATDVKHLAAGGLGQLAPER